MANGRKGAQIEEWLSIILALAATIFAPIAISLTHNWEPENKIFWTMPLWIGLFYLIFQMAFLLRLVSSSDRNVSQGVLDSVVAIFPLVAGLVLLALSIVDSQSFSFSSYQLNELAVLIIVGASEFLLTIWILFVLNRRTVTWGGGDAG
jgi:hypothetical protein